MNNPALIVLRSPSLALTAFFSLTPLPTNTPTLLSSPCATSPIIYTIF